MRQLALSSKLCFLFVVLSFVKIFPTIKGSDSALSVEPYYTFLSTGTDNEMLGFGWFKNGFALEDASTACTFDSVFPVSGDIYLNGGNLYLNSDLLLQNITTWHEAGKVYGNGYVVDLCDSLTSFGCSSIEQVFNDSIIYVRTDMTFSGSVRFQGDCVVNGDGKVITLGDNGRLLFDSGSTVTLKNIYLEGISEGKIICLDDSTRVVFDDVKLSLNGDYSFTAGSILFKNKNIFSGGYTFSYETCHTSSIYENSSWKINDINIYIGRKEATNYVEPLYFYDNTSVWKLNDCSLFITASGMKLTRGKFTINHDVILDIDSTCSENGLILGDSGLDNDIIVSFCPGSALHCDRGHVVLQENDPDFLSLKQGNARLIRGAQNVVCVVDNANIENLIIDMHASAAMEVASGKNLDYLNCDIETAAVDFKLTGRRGTDYCNFLVGDGDIFIQRGTIPVYTYIWGTGNTIRGNGYISGLIALQDSSAEVSFNLNGALVTDVAMGGGTIALSSDLHMTQDNVFTGEGVVNLSNNSLYLGSQDKTWTGSICWDGDYGRMHMNSKVSLSGTWTFSGECLIDGHVNDLDLGSIGQIVVERGSKLILKDVNILGVSGNNIRCLDNLSSIEFRKSKLFLDSNFSFTTGSMDIVEELEVYGDYTLDYQSTMPITISLSSLLSMMKGSTFSYNPASDSRDLLVMEYSSSVFELNDATLHSTETGVILTKGVLRISGDSYLSSDASIPYEGITLGDGLYEYNDVDTDVEANTNTDITSGYVVDKSVG